MKPFLRWPGGKYRQLNQILPHLGNPYRLFEPFVGAGSVFLNAGIQDVHINDVNPDLINLYLMLKHQGPKLIHEAELLCQWCDSEKSYNRIRERFNTKEYSRYSNAAFFLVMNRTGFNGMCRYNQSGEFNVPWGKEPSVYFPKEELQEFINSGLNITHYAVDFASMMAIAGTGDTIFCDPPYQPQPSKNGFTTYSGTEFTFSDQKRLVECAKQASSRGARVILTNSAVDSIQKLYTDAGFKLYPLTARRSVAANADSRGIVEDIIAVL